MSVAILPLGKVSEMELDFIDYVMRFYFHIRTRYLPAVQIPAAYYDADNYRYNANCLLDFVLHCKPKDVGCIIGVTNHDIFTVTNGNIFGYAYIKKGAAIYSTKEIHKPDLRGRINTAIKQTRSLKIILHEMGHVFGLLHCEEMNCVMNGITSLPAVLDDLSQSYCAKCFVEISLRLRDGFPCDLTTEERKR